MVLSPHEQVLKISHQQSFFAQIRTKDPQIRTKDFQMHFHLRELEAEPDPQELEAQTVNYGILRSPTPREWVLDIFLENLTFNWFFSWCPRLCT